MEHKSTTLLNYLVFWCAIMLPFALQAQIQLPSIFSSGMILQRDRPVKIWGKAAGGEKIAIQYFGKQYRINADETGAWQVTLPAQPAGGPHVIVFKGNNAIELHDVWFGDVWFCSGQSNMVHQLNIHDVSYAKEITDVNLPLVRQFLIPATTNLQAPSNTIPQSKWEQAVGENKRPFSAVAYFFAKAIHTQFNVPVGIINASVGGTPIEAWMSENALSTFPEAQKTIQQNKDSSYLTALISNNRNPTPQPINDKGLTENPKWHEQAYLPKNWKTMHIPGYWEDQGIKQLDGVVWYRKEIDIPLSMIGKPAKAFLGRIVDADELYINGQLIGRTTYMYPQRRYTIEKGILKPGKNLIVIRVTNQANKGGFVPDKPYYVFAENDTVKLDGDWQYKIGEVYDKRFGPPATRAFSVQNQPTALYNAMVSPLVPFSIKGFIWYQGESNAGRPANYALLQKTMIKNWRTDWGDSTLPFFYVQLPGYMDVNYLPEESSWALMREAQMKSLSEPHTGMAVTIDLGEWNDVHPDNKKDVGERLAKIAAYKVYHQPVVFSGPSYRSYEIKGNKIVLHFDNVGGGLTTSDGEAVATMSIAGADGKFYWAETKIAGNTIEVWHRNIAAPKHVRYAWADNPFNPNLCNSEGLPASPFRTDDL